ncbi:Mediator of RNA polymerase II transcription subunit 7 [Podochytrium sp. JEL0797]|nr:Mediator of RNA polymerase II transcription subunit 7 [Podochytrium sp. JEL0797]
MDLQLQYPLPPAHYKRFTAEALAAKDDPLLLPPPPLGPGVAAYTVFGETLRLQDKAPLPKDLAFEQLFADEFDRAEELKRLNHSLLLNFLELNHVLTTQPEEYHRKIADIRLIFKNMHYLLNGYRPHQARDTLKLLMELQIKRRQKMAREIETCLHDVQAVFRDFDSTIFEPAGAGKGSSNTDMDVDMDEADGVGKPNIAGDAGMETKGAAPGNKQDPENAKYWEKKKRLQEYADKLK